MPSTGVLLFGDQTTSPFQTIKVLTSRSRDSVLLDTFLQRSLIVLKAHHDALFENGYEKLLCTVLDFADAYAETKERSTALTSALHCIAQLGSIILNSEMGKAIYGDISSRQYLLGLCTGLVPAAFVAASVSVGHLVQIGPECVDIALQVGIEAQRRSREIESGLEDWTRAITKISLDQAQTILDKFNFDNALPRYRQVYVSAVGDRSGVTLSGPPSTLSALLENNAELASFPSSKLGITAAYHASHLGAPDVARILRNVTSSDLPIRKGTRLVSTSSGVPYESSSLGEILQLVLDDILLKPLRLDLAIEDLANFAKDADVQMMILGPCGLTKTIRQTLVSHGASVSTTGAAQVDDLRDEQYHPDSIAVVGMSGRFPGGDNIDEFWQVIATGKDVHTKVPQDRFDTATHCDPSGKIKNSTLSAFGCFINNPGMFDTRLFNMSPREAVQTDPNQRQLLMVAYEALESAGYVQDGTPESLNVGTFFGVTADDYREYNSSQDIDVYYVTGGLRAFVPGRLNYHFKWEGPSFSLDTACSSSAAAIDLACQSLISGKCSMALAGGANIMTGPNLYAGLSRGGFLSPTGSSKTFDDSADGYCRGDAIGVVVLKRLSDAIKAGDNIRGVIRSAGTNHSAYASSITLPHSPSQQKLFAQVLREAKLTPEAVSYVELHGTGTQAGDTIEMNSVLSTFGANRTASNPLYVGAVKANVGHGEGAAGVTSAIKAMLMFREGIIPPHAGIKTRVNTKFPSLPQMNVRIASSAESFGPAVDGKRRVWINNFNATGGNTCLVLEEPPMRALEGADSRTHHIVTLSAKTAYSFRENQKRLHNYLALNSEHGIQDIAYTSTARKMHHGIRAAYVAATVQDLIQAISKDLARSDKPSSQGDKKPVVFSFAGQGSQYAGMGKQLFETSARFRDTIQAHDDLCKKLDLPSFINVINDLSADITTVTSPKVHCALLSLELALADLWSSWGVVPDVVLGHSIGEYAALTIAGVLSLADAFYLVAKRAELLEAHCEKNSRIMVAVSAGNIRAIELLQSSSLAHPCQVSCINGPNSTVFNMPSDSFTAFSSIMDRANIKSVKLNMPYAFHSIQMDAILTELRSLASGVQYQAPRIPIISTLFGQTISSAGTFNADYLVRQTREPVNFLAAVKTAEVVHSDAIWIEHGPDATCASLIRAILANSQSIVSSSLRGQKEDCWKTISKILAQIYTSGAQVDWKAYHQEHVRALRLVDLPTYAFDLKNYWLQYEGIWALEKNHHRCPEPKEIIKAAQPALVVSSFTSTCLQQIESETFKEETATVKFVSQLNRSGIYDLISGHFVNGVGLCPSAVYTDMAMTAAKYIYTRLHPSENLPAMDVRDFEIFRPLVLRRNDDTHVVKVSATKSAHSNSVHIAVSSQLGSISQNHARCLVEFGDGTTWARNWARNSYLVSDRIEHLRGSVADGAVDTLRGAMVYKIFSEIVEYPEGYKGIKEFSMNGRINEAVAKVQFRETPKATNFTCDPCWIDTIAQVPGFVLNGSTSTHPELVFLSTGWESLRIAKPLESGIEYSCYVRMQQADSPGLLLGDASLFAGNQIVAVATGLKFHEVRKDTLHRVLPGSRNLSARPALVTSPTQSSQTVPKVVFKTVSPSDRKPKSTTTRPSKQTVARQATSIFPKALQLIAQEVGVELVDLDDEANLEDLGIDSLLTISIGTKLKDELQLDLPLTLFSECGTVAQLRQYFQTNIDSVIVVSKRSDESSSSDEYGEDEDVSSATSVSDDDSQAVNIVDVIIAAIAKESGLSEDELDAETDFVDLGVDSLMTIAVLGTVLAQTGEQLPASLFSNYSTISALRQGLIQPKTAAQSRARSEPPKPTPTLSAKPKFQAEKYRSNTVLLQGDSKSTLPPMFFIADGAGSAASYLHFPQFASRLPVYALESPFLNCPSEYTCSIEEICQTYTAAIRATRPQGPYLLGGWSIGGIYAYETMQQLLGLGERVEGILIIDSPCPHKMEGLPPLTLEILEETGIFVGIPTRGGGPDTPMPLGQKQHIVGCVQAASTYDPQPLPIHQRPSHTYIIWSERGLFEQLSEKVKEASDQQTGTSDKTGINRDWLTGTRTSFGPKGWDRLLGDCECHPTEGDHFSCMNQPRIKTTGRLVADAIEKFLLKITRATNQAAPAANKNIMGGKQPADLRKARRVFDRVRMQTVPHLKETGFDGFWTHVYPLQRRLVLAYVVEAFAELGVHLDSLPAGEPIREIKYLSQHSKLIPQLHRILEDGQLVSLACGTYHRTANAIDNTSSQVLYQDILSRFPQHEAEHKLLNIAGSRLASVLNGKVDFLRMLFEENRELLAQVYTYAPMFDATSKQLSEFLYQLCKDVPVGEEVRILEIGGGLGGTTRPVVDMLRRNNIPFSYTFSDISGSLVAAARKTFAGTPNMQFTALDVEKEPSAKFKGKFNVIFSTNCVHATRNLYTSTKNIRSMLHPDGLLALVEFTENIFWFDIVFGLLEGWWLFEDARPHVLASEAFWRDSLRRAGYGEVALTDGETRECQTLRIIAAFQP